MDAQPAATRQATSRAETITCDLKKEGEGHVKVSLPHLCPQRGKHHDVKTLTMCSDIQRYQKKRKYIQNM